MRENEAKDGWKNLHSPVDFLPIVISAFHVTITQLKQDANTEEESQCLKQTSTIPETQKTISRPFFMSSHGRFSDKVEATAV